MALKKSERLGGLFDQFNDLCVGPCDMETLERETVCHLVRENWVVHLDQFDCSYAEWSAMFRNDVHQAALQGCPGPPDAAALLRHKHIVEADRARRTGASIKMDDRCWVEARGNRWVVVDEGNLLLDEIEDPTWADEDAEDPEANLYFASPEEAMAAFLWADAITKARRARRQNARHQLGFDDPDASRDLPSTNQPGVGPK